MLPQSRAILFKDKQNILTLSKENLLLIRSELRITIPPFFILLLNFSKDG